MWANASRRLSGVEPDGTHPNLVGHEHSAESAHFAQPLGPLSECGSLAGRPQPSDADHPAVGQTDDGFKRPLPVPANLDRTVNFGDGREQAMDHSHGVEPLQQRPPPLLGDGRVFQQPLGGHPSARACRRTPDSVRQSRLVGAISGEA